MMYTFEYIHLCVNVMVKKLADYQRMMLSCLNDYTVITQ